MDGSRQDLDFGARAAVRVANEPAFAALDASGAPIIVVAGEQLSVIHLNATARAIFGDDPSALAERLFRSETPSARRLTQLVESVRSNSTLRLERLHLQLDAAPQTVTVLCRRLSVEDEPPCFAIAALGVRAAAAAERPATHVTPIPAVSPAPASPTDLRERLAARHGERAPRFLWKTDAAGRFIDVTHVLADVVGEEQADILGRSVDDVATRLGLGRAFVKAVASGKSWSGVDVDWPLDDAGAVVPATLGALPMMDAAHRFQGFQGYGVLHLDRVRLAANDPAAVRDRPALNSQLGIHDAPIPVLVSQEDALTPDVETATPATFEPEPSNAPAPSETPVLIEYPDNIVRLRPATARFVEPEPIEVEDPSALTTVERSAFDEIARALRDGEIAVATEADDVAPEEFDIAAGAAEEITPTPLVAETGTDSAQPEPLEPILDYLPVGVLVARGAQTLFVNRTLLDYLGYPDREAFDRDGGLARMFFGRTPNTVQPSVARPVAVQASDGEALDADAHMQIVDWQGEPATLLTLRRNRFQPRPGPEETALALARALEEKLARARDDADLFRAAFDNAEATAILVDGGRIEKVNAAFALRAGLNSSALEQRSISSLLIGESARALAERLSHLDREGTVRLTLRGRLGALDARVRRLDARRIALTLREPSARGADELEAARMAAEHASAAKSDFLARISHEIRTPLNAIIGFAEVMMEERLGPIGSERYREYLKDIHGSGSHVLSLVNDLLDLSKIEAGKMDLAFERVDANAIITECASIMQTQANENRVVMRLALAPQLPLIRADARALKQILLNLFSNAVKFNEPGGQVIASSALTEAGYVIIRVKDTGIGMSDDEVQTALEPFKQIASARQATQSQRGTGLGLPLTKALIEANHASFTIRSRKNEGTLVEIAFPPPQVLAAE